MIQYYFKTAFRSLKNNKAHAFINILGLSMGLLTLTLIALWVQSELCYDRFYSRTDRLYQIYTSDTFDGGKHAWGGTPAILGPILQAEQTGIEAVVRTAAMRSTLGKGSDRFTSKGMAADSAFFKLFDFHFIQGNPQMLLSKPGDIVVTASLAMRLFGTTHALGNQIKMSTIDTTRLLQVQGVIEDIPHNSKFNDVEFLCAWSLAEQLGQVYYTSWTSYNHSTYALLKEGVSGASVNEQIKDFVPRHSNRETQAEIFLHPAAKWHLYNKSENGQMVAGSINTLRVFILAGVFILLIAGINFINLSTARSEKRAKEIGVRKVIGARKHALIFQFLSESVLLAVLAAVFAWLMVVLTLPWFNQLIDEALTLSSVPYWFWLGFGALTLLTGLIAGIYPAFILSSFPAVNALKANLLTKKSGVTPRKVLVVVQFTISIFLTICTLVIARQIHYGQERDIGYDKNLLIYAPLNGDMRKNYELIKRELIQSGAASHVSKNQGAISRYSSNSWGFSWPGSGPEDHDAVFNTMSTDGQFSETMGVDMVAGRDIDLQAFPSDSNAMLINEAAVRRLGVADPIGTEISRYLGSEFEERWTVVGIIEDYIVRSPYEKVEPLMVFGPGGWFRYIHIRLNSKRSIGSNMEAIQAIVKKYNPNFPFDYQFVDADYARKFEKEQQTAQLTGLFSALAILIASLGLLGLITFTVQQRSKELGIRKVLGASITNLIRLLTADLLVLVFVAMLIAGPIAWWVMQEWLAGYAHRIDMAWWIILLGGTLGIGIALLSVGFQALRAARSNPVDALRDE